MAARQALAVLAIALGTFLCACASDGSEGFTPSDTVTASKATSAPATAAVSTRAPVITVPPDALPPPSPTATAAPIVEEAWLNSKYANVHVYTLEEQANEGRSLLHVAYPVTEHAAINDRLKELSEQFIDEFHTIAAAQEASYQDYIRDTGQSAASFVTHYIQHFDVTLANAKLLSLAIDQYRFSGGTGSAQATGHVFDRAAGTELAPSDFFVSDAYLGRLAERVREMLESEARAELAEADIDSESEREAFLASRLAMIQAGTEPLAENYDGLLFREDGTLEIQFDKYQVAPGYRGVVTIRVPVDTLADLLTPALQQLLGVAASPPAPSPSPLLTLVPSPTATLAPAADEVPGQTPGTTDCRVVLCVALTFDDGPSVYTDGLLDVLKAHEAHATFFVLGRSARVQQQTLARMAQEGHEIGNHSWSHLNFRELGDDQMREELDLTNALVQELTGTSPPHFRPPYGAYDDRVVTIAGMPLILWSLDPLDWRDRDADVVAERMREASAGAIILAHDIHQSTVDAIPQVLEALTARGIRFVTVSELMAPVELESGRVYAHQSPPE